MERHKVTLGYLDSIQTMGLSPLDDFSWNLGREEKSIHVLWAPSGCGKTTLCDAIEFSLFRDLRHKDTAALLEKLKLSRDEKIGKGFIKARWKFPKDFIEIKHDFRGTRTYSSRNDIPILAKEYEKSFLDLRVSLKTLQILYNGLTFVREIRNYPIFETAERTRFFDALNEILFDPALHRKIERSRARLARLRENELTKQGEKQNLWTVMEKVHSEPDLRGALERCQVQLDAVRENILNEEHAIQGLDRNLEERLNQPPPQLDRLIKTKTLKEEELRNLEGQVHLIDKQIDNLSKGIRPDLEERKKYFSNQPICPTCLKNRLEVWDQRAGIVCPECGMDSNLSGESEMEERYQEELSTLRDQRNKVGKDIIVLKKELKRLEGERKRLNNEYGLLQKTGQGIRLKLKSHQEKRAQLNARKQELMDEIKFLTEVMDPETRSKYDQVSAELETIRKEKAAEKERFQKLKTQVKGVLDNLIAEVEEEFTELAKKYLEFDKLVLDFSSGKVIVDEQSLDFYNLSGSERDIADLLTRICFWKALIKFKIAEKGFIVIDSLEVYDARRKADMIELLRSLSSDEFLVIFATNSQDTTQKLSDSPKKYECQRRGLWFFLRESQWLEHEEERVLNSETDTFE